jgi:hypothetical protein
MKDKINKKEFSFVELRFISVHFALACLNGYEGTFTGYVDGINIDWRKALKNIRKNNKKKSNEETDIEEPTIMFLKLLSMKQNDVLINSELIRWSE